MSETWTAGIMGNISQEDGSFDPHVMEGGAISTSVPYSSGGYGLIQWTGADYQRASDNLIKNLTNNTYGLDSLEGQIILISAIATLNSEVANCGDGYSSYAVYCLKKAHGTLENLNNLSVRQATDAWFDGVERAGKPEMANRYAGAEKYYEMFKGTHKMGSNQYNYNGNGTISNSTASNSSSSNNSSSNSSNINTNYSYLSGSVIEKYLMDIGVIYSDKDKEEISEIEKGNNSKTNQNKAASVIKGSINSMLKNLENFNNSSNSTVNGSNNKNGSSSTSNISYQNNTKILAENISDVLEYFKKLNKNRKEYNDYEVKILDKLKNIFSDEEVLQL